MIYVPLNRIFDNPFQRRAAYGDVGELAADIARHYDTRQDTRGLQQVPVGRLVTADRNVWPCSDFLETYAELGKNQLDDDALFVELEFGHRRLRAFRLLAETRPEFERLPVFIRDLDDAEMLDGVWSENRQRRDLSAVEEAELLKIKLERVQAGGGSQRDVAEQWGLARSTVANRLALLNMPAEMQAANRAGQISERQMMRLRPIVRLMGAVNGSVEWHGRQDVASIQHFEVPPAPGTFLEYVIQNGVSSDEVGAMCKRMWRHAGEKLPYTIAKETFDWIEPSLAFEGMVQTSCKKCPHRWQDFCLDGTCLAIKKTGLGRRLAHAASQELGLPFSEKREDFPSGHESSVTLMNIHRAGGGASIW